MKKLLAKLKSILSTKMILSILSHVKDYKVVYGTIAAVASITGLTINSEAVSKAIVAVATMLESYLTVVTG